jgi:hypothetical protein
VVSSIATTLSNDLGELTMSYTRLPRVLCLALLFCGVVPLRAAGDGTVKGTLTVNGKKFPLTHIYAREREAWPADKKASNRFRGSRRS